MTRLRKVLVFAALCSVAAWAAPAGAASIVTPGPGTFAVPSDAHGRPQSFTVVATGFPPGASVSVEQCDGTSAADAGWSPLGHCDNATAPAAVIVGADGFARFPAGDPNFGFVPFSGASPQGLFNCLAPGEPSPHNGQPDFTSCQVRVATSTIDVTSDQALRSMRVPARRAGASNTTRPTGSTRATGASPLVPTTNRARADAVKRATKGTRSAAGADAPTVVVHAGGVGARSSKSAARLLSDALTSGPGIVLELLAFALAVAAVRRASRRRAMPATRE
jgi:hypothetical protein